MADPAAFSLRSYAETEAEAAEEAQSSRVDRFRRLFHGFTGREFHAYGGLGLLGAGLWMVYPPAALIVVGLAGFYLGVWWDPHARPKG